MKLLLDVSVERVENYLNRKIAVDENILLEELCEYIIISLDGKNMPLYSLDFKNKLYLPDAIAKNYEKKPFNGKRLKDLKLKKFQEFYITYDFDRYYTFNVKVDDFKNEIEELKNKDFYVLSGKGYGIIDNIFPTDLQDIYYFKEINRLKCLKKSEKEYLEKTFDLDEINNRVIKYKEFKREMTKPKQYTFNISLEGFNKEIKRKMIINNNITVDDFCRSVIVSMKGDLFHLYSIKINNSFLGESYLDIELYYFNLQEKDKLQIIYDFGDNWIFNIKLSKIKDGYLEENCKVIDGKGYGIIDDCGGISGLEDIFNGKNEDWGIYNIDDFDLEECNKDIENYC